MKRHLSLAIVACELAGCANYSEVSGKRPLFLPKSVGRGILVNAEAEIEKALREDRSKPVGALDEYLAAAQTAEQQLHHSPRDAAAKRDYNFAVGRVFEIIHDAKLAPWMTPALPPSHASRTLRPSRT